MREILFAREEADERAPPFRVDVPHRAAQHGELGFERVEDRLLRRVAVEFERDLALLLRKCPKVCGELDADAGHGSVCASTDRTAGRSRTIGVQLSPASAEP